MEIVVSMFAMMLWIQDIQSVSLHQLKWICLLWSNKFILFNERYAVFYVKFTVKYGNFLGNAEHFHGWKGLSNGNWDEDYKSTRFN